MSDAWVAAFGGAASGIIGSFFAPLAAVVLLPLLFFCFKLRLPYAFGTALAGVIAASGARGKRFELALVAVATAAAIVLYVRGDIRPVVTATAMIGAIPAAAWVRNEQPRSRLRFVWRAAMWSFFVVGVLVDRVDPIAFGTIVPAHLPLLPNALVHGSAAAMMHAGVLLLLLTPIAYSFTRRATQRRNDRGSH